MSAYTFPFKWEKIILLILYLPTTSDWLLKMSDYKEVLMT
jgi:hypothetical protein